MSFADFGVVGTVAPGNMKLKDVNGDGVVDIKDETVIGNANPKSTGGFVINGNVIDLTLWLHSTGVMEMIYTMPIK